MRQQAGVALYGTLVIAYLFLGGASGGTFLVTATWSLALHHLYPHRSALVRRDFRLLRERIYAIATAVLAAAMLCLLWDLNYPDRALMIFAFARPTVLTFGACALTALLAIGALLVLANLFHIRFFSGTVKGILEAACAILAVAVMGYTGVFLYSNVGVPFWHSLFWWGFSSAPPYLRAFPQLCSSITSRMQRQSESTPFGLCKSVTSLALPQSSPS